MIWGDHRAGDTASHGGREVGSTMGGEQMVGIPGPLCCVLGFSILSPQPQHLSLNSTLLHPPQSLSPHAVRPHCVLALLSPRATQNSPGVRRGFLWLSSISAHLIRSMFQSQVDRGNICMQQDVPFLAYHSASFDKCTQ